MKDYSQRCHFQKEAVQIWQIKSTQTSQTSKSESINKTAFCDQCTTWELNIKRSTVCGHKSCVLLQRTMSPWLTLKKKKMFSSCSHFCIIFILLWNTKGGVRQKVLLFSKQWKKGIVIYTAKLQKGQKLMMTYFKTGTFTRSAMWYVVRAKTVACCKFSNKCKIAIRSFNFKFTYWSIIE